jgi:hypothetical protein
MAVTVQLEPTLIDRSSTGRSGSTQEPLASEDTNGDRLHEVGGQLCRLRTTSEAQACCMEGDERGGAYARAPFQGDGSLMVHDSQSSMLRQASVPRNL